MGLSDGNQAEHKQLHKSMNPLRNIIPPSVVSKVDPETGHFNPFPTYPFTGSLRPVYPLSPRREVPKNIPHPEWAANGIPNYPYVRRNNITILDEKGQNAMRKSCKLAREVLDIAAAAVKPGITTDQIDEIVHKATIERNVSVIDRMQCDICLVSCTAIFPTLALFDTLSK